MKRCRFEVDGEIRYGVVQEDVVLDPSRGDRHPLEEVRLLAPVRPRKFLGIGLNYADHISESGMEAPEFPVFFNKQSTCVVGPGTADALAALGIHAALVPARFVAEGLVEAFPDPPATGGRVLVAQAAKAL